MFFCRFYHSFIGIAFLVGQIIPDFLIILQMTWQGSTCSDQQQVESFIVLKKLWRRFSREVVELIYLINRRHKE